MFLYLTEELPLNAAQLSYYGKFIRICQTLDPIYVIMNGRARRPRRGEALHHCLLSFQTHSHPSLIGRRSTMSSQKMEV